MKPSATSDSERNCTRNDSSKRQQRVVATDTLRFAELKSQDPSVFAHLLADHFVAREANATATAASTFAQKSPQQLARPVAGSVTLGSFRSWQFGERCLATYRVLFGRPLWANSTATATSVTSPRPIKRRHCTPPTSSSSEGSDGGHVDQLKTLQTESGEGLLDNSEGLMDLPTVEELLELPTDETFGLADTQERVDDVLAGLAIGLDEGAGDDIDLLWDLDASEGDMLTEGGEEELRFLHTSPNGFVDMDGI